MKKTVIELFAGVGGFRVGLNKINSIDENGIAIEKKRFKFVWANQWEPSTKIQHAFDCYKTRFNCKESECSNQDISKVDKASIPDHSLLCGGFPCQDYSVARSLKNEKGIQGKKGVLWWQINDILCEKKPPFVLLENVDRLIKAPSKQRGQAFGIMLRCFFEQGYSVEWRVINAAQYGHPQRRRRIFIFAYKNDTKYANLMSTKSVTDIVYKVGIFAKKFPVEYSDESLKEIDITNYKDLVEVSDMFKCEFYNAGVMNNGGIYTVKTKADFNLVFPLRKIRLETEVDEKFFSDEIRQLDALKKRIGDALKQALGIAVNVKLVEPKTIERSEGKAKRVIDRRNLV